MRLVDWLKIKIAATSPTLAQTIYNPRPDDWFPKKMTLFFFPFYKIKIAATRHQEYDEQPINWDLR